MIYVEEGKFNRIEGIKKLKNFAYILTNVKRWFKVLWYHCWHSNTLVCCRNLYVYCIIAIGTIIVLYRNLNYINELHKLTKWPM